MASCILFSIGLGNDLELGTKPLPAPMTTYYQKGAKEKTSVKF